MRTTLANLSLLCLVPAGMFGLVALFFWAGAWQFDGTWSRHAWVATIVAGAFAWLWFLLGAVALLLGSGRRARL